MPGSGTVRAVVKNTTEFPLNPVGDAIISGGGTVIAQPQLIPASATNGKAGAFQSEAEAKQPIVAISVYELPGDETKWLILLIKYTAETSGNEAKAAVYDKSKYGLNLALLQHVSGNANALAEYKITYGDSSGNERNLAVSCSIGSEMFAKAGFKVSLSTKS